MKRFSELVLKSNKDTTVYIANICKKKIHV